MNTYTPLHTSALARRFGLTFAAVRHSRLIPRLLDAERERGDLTATIEKLLARVRAYRRAGNATRGSERLDWRFREGTIRRQLDATRNRRRWLDGDIAALTAELRDQARAATPAVATAAPTRPRPVDEHEQRIRDLFTVGS